MNWPAFDDGFEHEYRARYELDASTSTDFITYTSSITQCRRAKHVTVIDLTSFTTYYLRAGSINWNSVLNYDKRTEHADEPGVAPTPVTLTAVYITSATVTYGTVGGKMAMNSMRRAPILPVALHFRP